MKEYTEILRSHNLKATPQRLVIIDSIVKAGHISIDKLYTEVKSQFSSVSLATIYKNINSMISNALLLEVKLPDAKSFYEVAKHPHSHLVCKHCGDIVDIQIDTTRIVNSISQDYKFSIDKSDLVFSGSCETCSSK